MVSDTSKHAQERLRDSPRPSGSRLDVGKSSVAVRLRPSPVKVAHEALAQENSNSRKSHQLPTMIVRRGKSGPPAHHSVGSAAKDLSNQNGSSFVCFAGPWPLLPDRENHEARRGMDAGSSPCNKMWFCLAIDT